MPDKRCKNSGHFIDDSWDVCPYCPEELAEQRDHAYATEPQLPSGSALESWLSSASGVQSVILLLIDIDDLAGINKRCGHLIGDAVLKDVGNAVTKATSRYNGATSFAQPGGKFAIGLSGYTRQEGIALAAAISGDVANLLEGRLVTISVGLTDSSTSDCATSLRDATTALLKAKRDGRNRIESYGPDTTLPPLAPASVSSVK